VGEEKMTIKKPIRSQQKNSESLEESNGLAPLKEKDVEAIHNSQFEEGAYFEAVVDMEEWF
jgi:hypothetical protein